MTATADPAEGTDPAATHGEAPGRSPERAHLTLEGPRAEPARRTVGPLVPTKLVPTAVPGTAVFRRQLVQRLDDLTQNKLVLLIAPPGYGKSVLLAQWASTSAPRRIAWLTVESADDADRFARHLCAALTGADGRPRDGILRRVERGGRRMGTGFVSALLADAASAPPTAVVLDDFHTMGSAELLAEIGLLIEEAPSQ